MITYTVDEPKDDCVTAETEVEAIQIIQDRYLLNQITVLEIETSEDYPEGEG